MKKSIILFILCCIYPVIIHGQQLPDSIRIYYYQEAIDEYYGGGTESPWGWIADSAIPACQIIEENPDYLLIKDTCIISKLLPSDVISKRLLSDEDRLNNNWYSEWSDSRFVLLLYSPEKTDTLSLPLMDHFPIRYNTDYSFVDPEYYKTVVSYIAKRDRKFRKWYKLHYYDGKFHFFLDKQLDKWRQNR